MLFYLLAKKIKAKGFFNAGLNNKKFSLSFSTIIVTFCQLLNSFKTLYNVKIHLLLVMLINIFRLLYYKHFLSFLRK